MATKQPFQLLEGDDHRAARGVRESSGDADADRFGSASEATVTNLVPLQAPEYREALAETAEELAAMQTQVMAQAVRIAMAGPWKAWADAQPVGAVAHIGPEELAGAKDGHIAALLGLLDHIEDVLASLPDAPRSDA